MIRRTTAVMIAMAALLGGCQPWQRVGSEDRPQPGVTLARMFDPASVYRAMGFLVSGPPTSFIGTVRYLKGPVPDSTLTLCALSLANHALSFRRDASPGSTAPCLPGADTAA